MSWLLNSMEPKISEIFAFSGNALDLWESVRDLYGHQNNVASIFELQREIGEAKQDGKSFTDHQGKLKSLCGELGLYRTLTRDQKVLLKRVEEDKTFQLLASLTYDYENFRGQNFKLIASYELATFKACVLPFVGKKLKKKVMNPEPKIVASESNASVVDKRND